MASETETGGHTEAALVIGATADRVGFEEQARTDRGTDAGRGAAFLLANLVESGTAANPNPFPEPPPLRTSGNHSPVARARRVARDVHVYRHRPCGVRPVPRGTVEGHPYSPLTRQLEAVAPRHAGELRCTQVLDDPAEAPRPNDRQHPEVRVELPLSIPLACRLFDSAAKELERGPDVNPCVNRGQEGHAHVVHQHGRDDS